MMGEEKKVQWGTRVKEDTLEEGPLFDPVANDIRADVVSAQQAMADMAEVRPTGIIHPVIAVLDDMQELVERKAKDYAKDANVFSNFEFAADVAGVTVEQVFLVMLGTKMARLRELAQGGVPNFESYEDTKMDMANYAALSVAYEREN